jgi:hypothetical protein
MGGLFTTINPKKTTVSSTAKKSEVIRMPYLPNKINVLTAFLHENIQLIIIVILN